MSCQAHTASGSLRGALVGQGVHLAIRHEFLRAGGLAVCAWLRPKQRPTESGAERAGFGTTRSAPSHELPDAHDER